MNPEIHNTLETKRLLIKQINQEELLKSDKGLHQKFEGYTNQSNFSLDIRKNTLIFSITHKVNSQVLGLIFLKSLNTSSEMECYFILFPQYRGSGYAIEALKKSIEFAFSTLKIDTLFAYVSQDNRGAWLVAERSGMKYMGDIIIEQKNKKVMKFSMNKNDFDNIYLL
ncbi:MAG: GNAT family N-acetyltransferase [Candidatus Lokiarchaeota archaeon]|nr:GNAT family N-acetyltransferase [Candidatus Lokiarchaeota archaeon]